MQKAAIVFWYNVDVDFNNFIRIAHVLSKKWIENSCDPSNFEMNIVDNFEQMAENDLFCVYNNFWLEWLAP